MPPEWMWPLDEEIVAWMENVNSERQAKYGGSSKDDDTDGGPMMSNEYSRGRR
jgi:hypothetical protein